MAPSKALTLTLDAVLKNWPLKSPPRPIQISALEKTIESFNNGMEFVALEVPVGGGKSALAFALARTMGTSYTLTLTEQLQHQYLRDFQQYGMEPLKGRGKYACAKAGEGYTCADGALMFEGKDCCGPDLCPYQLAKQRAFEAPHLVANYHSYLFNLGLSAGKKRPKKGELSDVPNDAWSTKADAIRDLVVLDEAHCSESFLLEQAGVEVRLDKLTLKLAPLPIESDENNIRTEPYLKYMQEELIPQLTSYLKISERRGILDPKTKRDLNTLLSKLNMVLANPEDEWVAERTQTPDRKGFLADRFALKPLRVARYGSWLTGFGKKLLIMSGTILDAYQMTTSIGLDPEKGDFHTFDSPFPVENRPIYIGNLDMGFKARDESWPVMVEQVGKLLNSHSREKGLLLAPSNKMLFHITKELAKTDPATARRIIIASGENRVQKYNEHLASRMPTVLGASGFWEGADLAEDASRFQIIPQLPRPMWQGQIAKRAAREPNWYTWLTYVKLLQGCGRSVRSEKDTAVTYILDRDFRKEFKKPKGLIPLWVKSSVQLVG